MEETQTETTMNRGTERGGRKGEEREEREEREKVIRVRSILERRDRETEVRNERVEEE